LLRGGIDKILQAFVSSFVNIMKKSWD